MQQRLKQVLLQRQKRHLVDNSRVSSAVLIPVYYREGEYYILFTKRTEMVKDHKGQISFPGGAYEQEDRTLQNTALRECVEEIGLPTEEIEVLGELDDMFTSSSSYTISPFVAVIPWPHSLRMHPREVEEIIEVPISMLLDRNCVRQETKVKGDRVVNEYFYQCKENIIWGATARILNQFLAIWCRCED